MAEFSVVDAAKAPARPRPSSSFVRRMTEYDAYVAGVKKGQVGRLAASDGETARGIALRIKRAGVRIGKPVETWVVDGVTYFKVS